MAFSYTVHHYLSPRVLEVLEPTTDITVQELVDACREWEDSPAGMGHEPLIDAAGKEDLGGGVSVGITATLQNTVVMFQPRTTPIDDGVGRTCDQTDSSGKQLYVNDADFVSAGVAVGDTVRNVTTGEWGTVTQIVDQYTLSHFPLSGFGGLGWTAGDNYRVFENENCSVTGGNVVAVDADGDQTDAFMPSPNVFLRTTSSSSATLMELAAIQYSSYGGGVTVDVANGVSGTAYPIGTPQQPVGNFTDALSIADERGFTTFYVIGDATVDSFGDYRGYVFVGESQTKTELDIDPNAQVDGCAFYDATVVGTLDGDSKLKNCTIGTLNYINGVIEQCLLESGVITLGGGAEAHFLDCWSGVAGPSTPVIDMGGSGQELSLRNYNGGITLRNKSGSDPVSLDINSGHVKLESTVTNGDIVVRGVGKITDESIGANVIIQDFLNPGTVADAVYAIGLDRALGLSQENYYLDQTVYNGNGQLTSGRIRTYLVPGSVGTGNDVLATYDITAVWSGTELQTYKVIKQ